MAEELAHDAAALISAINLRFAPQQWQVQTSSVTSLGHDVSLRRTERRAKLEIAREIV